MYDFEFYNPVKVIFGRDRLEELSSNIPASARIMLISGGRSAEKNGLLGSIRNILGERIVGEFSGIMPNPRLSILLGGVEAVKKSGADFLLAVGGGSVMDGTKFMALASFYKGDDIADDLRNYRIGSSIDKAFPIGVVCTLPATGSEMNCGGVVSHEDGKFYFSSSLVFPKFAFLDPSLTFTLPPEQVANGVVDSFVHILEVYVTSDVEARFQDRASEGLLKTLIEVGKKTMDEPYDYDSRANLVWCATMALNGMLSVGLPEDWRGHMLGHQLTASLGFDHGKSLAVVMPALWSVTREEKRDKILQFGERVLGICDGDSDEDARIDRIIGGLRDFFESLGVRTRLGDYGMGQEEVEVVLKVLESHGQGNPDFNRKVLLLSI